MQTQHSTNTEKTPQQNGSQHRDPALPLSDYTNAEALVRRHGTTMRYCYPWGKWLIWNGRHWELDTTGQVMRWAKDTIKRLAHKLPDLPDDKAKALLAHIKSSLSTGRLTAMVQQAQCEVAVKPEAFDTHPWLLNCLNGTLDLRTGILRPHAREDLLTMGLAVSYDTTATCPKWDAFLHKIMGGSDTMLAFLQRLVGYATTGSTQEQAMFVLYGSGANGKSTFLNTLLALLGPYGMKATSELLMVSKSDRHPTERTDLCGKRLVAAIETDQGRRLSEAFVKEATGSDRIRARRMREDNWEFDPTHTILLASNHKPEIRGTDEGIWRKVKLVPFTVTIPADEQTKDLMDQLQAEFPGILAWLVRGCLAWQDGGLQVPDEVDDATGEYRKEMDILQAFLEDCCYVDQGNTRLTIRATPLYTAYQKWCSRGGEDAVTQRRFGTSLKERGFTKDKKEFGYVWQGIGLHATSHDAPDTDEEGCTIARKGAAMQPTENPGDAWNGEQTAAPSAPIFRLNSSIFPTKGVIQKKGAEGAEGAGSDVNKRGPCPRPRCHGELREKYGVIRCAVCQWTPDVSPHAGGG